jgi:ABC-type proline/glycine betaine transport system permease subunit
VSAGTAPHTVPPAWDLVVAVVALAAGVVTLGGVLFGGFGENWLIYLVSGGLWIAVARLLYDRHRTIRQLQRIADTGTAKRTPNYAKPWR